MKVFLLAVLLAFSTFLHAQQSVSISISDTSGPQISRNIYGHFSEDLGRCIYDGFWTGDHIRMDVVEALKSATVKGGYCTRLWTEQERQEQDQRAQKGTPYWNPPGTTVFLK